MIAAIDAVLSLATCAGLVCAFFSFVVAVGSDNPYTQQTCVAAATLAFVVTTFCGLPLLVLRNL